MENHNRSVVLAIAWHSQKNRKLVIQNIVDFPKEMSQTNRE